MLEHLFAHVGVTKDRLLFALNQVLNMVAHFAHLQVDVAHLVSVNLAKLVAQLVLHRQKLHVNTGRHICKDPH